MNTFVLRHYESFTRVSLAMLAFGLGHFSLRLFGPTGGIVAASSIAACGAMMLTYSADPGSASTARPSSRRENNGSPRRGAPLLLPPVSTGGIPLAHDPKPAAGATLFRRTVRRKRIALPTFGGHAAHSAQTIFAAARMTA